VPGRLEERFESVMPIELENGSGETRNFSASGIYFVTDVALVEGAPVSFMLRFKRASGGPFLLRGEARVVRLERLGGKFGVGATVSHYELERTAPEAERKS
jgi:PilZ domain-containing protein